MARKYKPKSKLTDKDLKQIATLYQYHIPTKVIAQAFNISYAKANQVVNVVKLTNQQVTPKQLREVLTNI